MTPKTETELQRQIAFNNIVTAISTNFINMPLDAIDAGIERALEMLGSFTEVDRSYLFIYNLEQKTMSCRYEWCAPGVSRQIDHLQDIPLEALDWSNAILMRGETLHIPRVADLPPAAAIEKIEFRAQSIRSLIAVPMAYRGQPIGFLGFDAVRREKTWSDESIKLLRIVGEIFVNALEHKRAQATLHTAYQTLEQRVSARTREIERRRQELEALYHADEQLYRHLRMDQVLNVLVELAMQILKADKSSLMIWDPQRETLNVSVARGFHPDTLQEMRFALDEGAVGQVVCTGEPAVVNDTYQDERVARRITDAEGIRSFMHVPIKIEERIFGVFNVDYTEPRAFGDEELRLFVALAQRAALAIENAQLYDQAQHAAALQERQRLARELHDSVSQALYGIALGARTAHTLLEREPIDDACREKLSSPLDYVLSLAEAGLAEMRALIFELRPDALENEGLVAALQKQAAALRARHKVEVVTAFCEEPALPFAVKEAFYRVAQEALNNAIKHAEARQLTLRLLHQAERLVLEVEDDGVGFDTDGDYPGHLGLKTMHERVAQVGGTLTLESALGQGTRLRVELAR